MRFVDPLRTKMHMLMSGDSGIPLEQARMTYGSRADYECLAEEVAREIERTSEPVVVDMIPLKRLGNEDALASILKQVSPDLPLTILARDGPVLETLKRSLANETCQLGIYDASGYLVSWEGALSLDTRIEAVRETLQSEKFLGKTRRRIAHMRLLELLSPGGVIHPYPGCELPPEDLVEMYGRWYLRMPNRMLVTCYLDIKKALCLPINLTAITYEVIYSLYGYFVTGGQGGRPCDVVVVPNNTALIIGSALQAFTGIPLCVIDKLGPIPSRRIANIHTSIELRNKQVCVLVEVSATGGELDRTIMFLSSRRAQVSRVITCYNLEVGRSMLTAHTDFVSLCRPKRELGYVYRSE